MTYKNFLKNAPKAFEGCHPTVMEKRYWYFRRHRVWYLIAKLFNKEEVR